MRKRFLFIPAFFLLLIVTILSDYIYFPLISFKAEEVAKKYLEEKYGEDFVIEESSFSKALGDEKGIYWIYAHPLNNPDISAQITVSEDMLMVSDDYLKMKWRLELNEQFSTTYKNLYGDHEKYSFMVNVSFPEHAFKEYNASNTYLDVFQSKHNEISNIIFANVILNSSNDMDYQLDFAYKLIQHLKDQKLNYFSVEINYYKDTLKQNLSLQDNELNYKEFKEKHLNMRDYVFDFYYDSNDDESKKKLSDIITSEDLQQYIY
ncbi:TATA-box binding protein OS=Ureibacillus acetophenoni OX=614649 GN=SAMN05877842_10878 PE=4 SV=1 [Ureibacillus acetophenoni]